MMLDLALQKLQVVGGLANSDETQVAVAAEDAAGEVAGVWESEQAVPPALIWRRTLDDARTLTFRALTHGDDRLPHPVSYDEVAFGRAEPKTSALAPCHPH